jgi:glycosyltransferase involved in cell wall biosynthesis
MSFFTSNRYLVELSSVKSAHAYVLPASWLDDRQLIDPSLIPGKFAGGQKCRLLFAGRLTEAKGVLVLVDAIERSDVRIDIIGEGELGALCRDLAARFSDRVRVLSPVPYGDPFSTLMDGYHAIVVPTLSDEQPRILFDAYARGLPVIASDRGGHLDLVRPGETGFLVPAGDSQALAEAMDTITRNPSHLQSMAMAARQFVQHRTHAAMHRDRADLISKAILENKPKVSCSTAA